VASIATIAPTPPARKPQPKRWLPFVAAAALLMIGGGFESASRSTGLANGYLVDASKSGQRQAVLQAAGEFRVVAANMLWAKVVDHYHHEFMAKGGEWDKNPSLLPLLNTIIELDPHFTQAYEMMGGTLLPKLGRLDEGRRILAKGIKNNPNDWELDREMAMLYAWRERRPADALPYAQAGLANAPDNFSKNIMGKLCTTLRRQIAEGHPYPSPPGS